jgi:hypothetical protein
MRLSRDCSEAEFMDEQFILISNFPHVPELLGGRANTQQSCVEFDLYGYASFSHSYLSVKQSN